jgi:hypothetical protein
MWARIAITVSHSTLTLWFSLTRSDRPRPTRPDRPEQRTSSRRRCSTRTKIVQSEDSNLRPRAPKIWREPQDHMYLNFINKQYLYFNKYVNIYLYDILIYNRGSKPWTTG